MLCIDFEYNGQRLSDYGCMICSFGSHGKGVQIVPIGSNLTFNTVDRYAYNRFDILGSKYEEPYIATFQICKHSCDRYNLGTMKMEEELVSQLMRWLNKKRNCKFKMLYDDGQYANVYFKGTFPTIQMVKLNGEIIGMELTFQANAPFGYYEPLEFYMEFPDTVSEYCIYDTSDEEGAIYPSKVEITVLQSGDLEICNSMETKRTIIKNCVVGEIISFDDVTKNPVSNVEHSRLYNDFNYTFIRIINKCGECDNYYEVNNEEDKRENVFTVSLPCNIYLKYSPICKSGMVI